MPRPSQKEQVTMSVHHYLADAELQTSEDFPLHVRSVAQALHVSPTTLYKYHLDDAIAAARDRQRANAEATGKALEKRTYQQLLREYQTTLEQERERNKGLVAKIVLMEANATRLGFDPEDLYRSLPKPLRSMPRIGERKDKKW